MGARVRGKRLGIWNAAAVSGAVLAATPGGTMAYAPGGSPQSFTFNGSVTALATPGGAMSYGDGSITPTDVLTMTLDPVNTGTALPVTFAQVFAAGDVPAGASVEVVSKTTQFNALSTHGDGSIRHALLTVFSNTSAGVPQIVTLRTRSPVTGTAITKANVLASAFSAAASLNIGGTVYSLAARDLLDGTVTPLVDKTYFAGPYCAEFIVGAALRNGGSPHAHLAAYFHVRAYSSAGNGTVDRVRCDVVIENGWTFVASPADVTYTPTITVGGATVYNTAVTHFHHTRWHLRQTGESACWWGGYPNVYAKHNVTYLQDTNAVPKYETLTPSTAYLNGLRQSTAPMDNGDHTDYMDNTGYQDAIGPVPRWDATYLVSGDKRAFNCMLANADGGAAYIAHFRDEVSKLPVSIDSYPQATIADPGASSPVIPNPSTTNPHDAGSFASHQPSIGFVPFLVTGDYYYLEEMQFWSSYNLIWTGWQARRGDPAYGQSSGAYGVFYNGTIRGQAWALRSLSQAAWATPDADALKSYFTTKLNNNLAYWTWQYPQANSADATPFGSMYSVEKESANEYRGFYDNYMSWSIQYCVDLGFSNAVAFRDYKLQMPIGLMGLTASEYCFQLAPAYNLILGPSNTTYYTTWAQVYAATNPADTGFACGTQAMATHLGVALNEMTGGQNQTDYYFASMLPALAACADSGLAGGLVAWNRANLSGVHPDFSDNPTWAVRARNDVPAWHAALSQNEVYQFPSSLPEQVDPCPAGSCSYSGAVGFRGIMDAWSGGTLDTTRDLLYVFGGGHSDYYGNEMLAFDVRAGSWARLTEPKAIVAGDLTPGNSTGIYVNGQPASQHSQAGVVFTPIADAVFIPGCFAPAGPTGISGSNAVFKFNPTNYQWTQLASVPNSGGTPSGHFSVADSDGNIWYHSGEESPNRLYKYVPGTNTWTAHAQFVRGYYPNSGVGAAYDSARNRMITVGRDNDGHMFYRWDLNNPNNAPVALTGIPGAVDFEGNSAIVYDPVNDRYISWVGGQTLHVCNPTTFAWSTISLTGANPGAIEPRGMFGRFAYVPSLHGIVLVAKTSTSVYFIKL